MKNISFKLTLPAELLSAAQQRASDQERSTAAYIRQLIKADLAKAGEQQLDILDPPKRKRR